MSESAPTRREFWSTVAVIAATYGYFLIFAQFAFLELLRAAGGVPGLRPAMAAMGLAGVAGSLLAAWRYRPQAYRRALVGGAGACALAAAAAHCSAAFMRTSAWRGIRPRL